MAQAATETRPKRWYIVHAYSNFENKVADSIREQAKQRGLSHLFDEIMVPTEKVVEVRRGRKVDAERKFFPGYVLVKMNLTDEAYHLIKNTPNVTGFLGADNKPMPISEGEAQRILNQVQEGIERPKPSISFEVGEQVRVSDEIEGLGRSMPSCTWDRMRCASPSEIGIGFLSAPRKPVTFGVFLMR